MRYYKVTGVQTCSLPIYGRAPTPCFCCWLLVARAHAAVLLFQRSLRSCQPCGQQPEGRAGYVVEANLVAELDGLWIAAVLAADSHFEGGSGVASLGRGHLHQQTDSRLIERGEWVLFEDAMLHVGRQEVVDVVA